MWDVFKTSTEKLANCHLDLVRKLQELIKEVQKYGEEQVKSHKKVSVLLIIGLVGQILNTFGFFEGREVIPFMFASLVQAYHDNNHF